MKNKSPLYNFRLSVIIFIASFLLLALGTDFCLYDAKGFMVIGTIIITISVVGFIAGFIINNKAKCPKCGKAIRGAIGTYCQFCGHSLDEME